MKPAGSLQQPAASRDLRPAIGETSFFFPPCPSQQKETEMVRMSDTKVPEGKFGADGRQQPAVSSGPRFASVCLETLRAVADVNHHRNLSKTFDSVVEVMKDLEE